MYSHTRDLLPLTTTASIYEIMVGAVTPISGNLLALSGSYKVTAQSYHIVNFPMYCFVNRYISAGMVLIIILKSMNFDGSQINDIDRIQDFFPSLKTQNTNNTDSHSFSCSFFFFISYKSYTVT